MVTDTPDPADTEGELNPLPLIVTPKLLPISPRGGDMPVICGVTVTGSLGVAA
jgi:hypothetical protein